MNEARQEGKRRLIEMAVAYGRSLQNSQTGYLHYFYQNLEEGNPALTIPIVENVLFALALLRSRTVENGTEAKDLLDKLLHFQHVEGNFPIYLHEYPECRDRCVAVHLAISFFWILKNFHQVLGNDLKKRLERALLGTVQYALATLKERALPYHLTLKIAASAKAVGLLLKHREIEDQGQLLLDQLQVMDSIDWYSPTHLGTILSALQMVFLRLDESPWNHFWRFLEDTWHRQGCTYIGPGMEVYQVGFEPEVTLYDLYLSFFSDQFSERCLKPHRVHLEGALIQSSEEILNVPQYPVARDGVIKGSKWRLWHEEKWGYSVIDKGGDIPLSNKKGFHPFYFVIGSPQRVHTLVCQAGTDKAMEFQNLQKQGLLFYLDEPAPVEDREKNRDIIFYFDLNDSTEIWVGESRATTFTFDERIEIRTKSFVLSLTFVLEEGEGRFLGHIMRGNRPSQLNLKGNKRFNAYDWQIFLRTVNRTGPCKVRVKLNWENAI